jgi:hypothetical protein
MFQNYVVTILKLPHDYNPQIIKHGANWDTTNFYPSVYMNGIAKFSMAMEMGNAKWKVVFNS